MTCPSQKEPVGEVEQLLEKGGARYFGAMTASVSHDIKNCLAIMNENVGLMGDLIALSRQRPPLDTERIESISHRITSQIQRADTIIKTLNQFSHSVDKTAQPVDLSAAVDLAVAMGARQCANSKIAIHQQTPEKFLQVTAPFFLMLQLIWTVMEGTMDVLPPNTFLDVTPLEREGRPAISFSAEHPIGTGIEKALGSLAGQNLLTQIPAEVTIGNENQQADLIFPLSSPAGM